MSEEKCYVGTQMIVADELDKCTTWCGAKDPLYICSQMRNPSGINSYDICNGIRDIFHRRLDDPVLNACVQYVLPYVDEDASKNTGTRDDKTRVTPICSFYHNTGSSSSREPITRLVGFPFYGSCRPAEIKSFTEDGKVFIVITMVPTERKR